MSGGGFPAPAGRLLYVTQHDYARTPPAPVQEPRRLRSPPPPPPHVLCRGSGTSHMNLHTGTRARAPLVHSNKKMLCATSSPVACIEPTAAHPINTLQFGSLRDGVCNNQGRFQQHSGRCGGCMGSEQGLGVGGARHARACVVLLNAQVWASQGVGCCVTWMKQV